MPISAGANYEHPAPALVRHRRRGLRGVCLGGVWFCRCISSCFSYFKKHSFREGGGLVAAMVFLDTYPYWNDEKNCCISGSWRFIWCWAFESVFPQLQSITFYDGAFFLQCYIHKYKKAFIELLFLIFSSPLLFSPSLPIIYFEKMWVNCE